MLHFSGAYRCSGNLPHWIENNPHVRGIVQRQPYQFAYGENSFTIKKEPFTINNDHAFVAFFKYNGYNRRGKLLLIHNKIKQIQIFFKHKILIKIKFLFFKMYRFILSCGRSTGNF